MGVLLLVLSCYVVAGTIVHMLYQLHAGQLTQLNEQILHVSNEQQRIEWLVRTLYFRSMYRGQELQLTVIDYGSNDDTLPIIQLLEREGLNITIIEADATSTVSSPLH